jgi:glycosyltransferase involved in cell wall biosynthesis
MEQTLGHVTHARNLRAVIEQLPHLFQPEWLPIPYPPRGYERFLPLVNSQWSIRASLRARLALDRVMARQSLDAVMFHTQVTSLFSQSIMRRLPTVVSMDATPINFDSVGFYYQHRAAGKGFLDRQRYRLNREALHAAASVVTWSDWARQSVVSDYGVDSVRVHVIAPGAAPSYFEIGKRRLAAGSPVRSDSAGRVRILFVGGDFYRKGGPLLLELMRGPLGERCDLDIVTGADVVALPHVTVHHGLGPNSAELVQLFERADVFVLPSYADCLAMVLMEAGAAALPVITTMVGALPEAVMPGESGALVPPSDGRALSAALEMLVSDAALRGRMGRASHELAIRKFDSVRNNSALLEILQSAIHGPRSARTTQRVA